MTVKKLINNCNCTLKNLFYTPCLIFPIDWDLLVFVVHLTLNFCLDISAVPIVTLVT